MEVYKYNELFGTYIFNDRGDYIATFFSIREAEIFVDEAIINSWYDCFPRVIYSIIQY